MRHSTMDGLIGLEGESLERLIARGRRERSRALYQGLALAWRWFVRQAKALLRGDHPELKRSGCG